MSFGELLAWGLLVLLLFGLIGSLARGSHRRGRIRKRVDRAPKP